jgi:hypothetical protein
MNDEAEKAERVLKTMGYVYPEENVVVPIYQAYGNDGYSSNPVMHTYGSYGSYGGEYDEEEEVEKKVKEKKVGKDILVGEVVDYDDDVKVFQDQLNRVSQGEFYPTSNYNFFFSQFKHDYDVSLFSVFRVDMNKQCIVYKLK